MPVFEELFKLDVNDKVEKKEGLSYLSWAYAWAETMKRYPEATYEILPYEYDEKLGYMCWTQVTIDGVTRKMWLPVMDGKNKAMKAEPYTYQTKYGEKTVEPATMFDINKTIMRCLVKNLAMFGLGLYIYAGEDLPETDEAKDIKKEARVIEDTGEPITDAQMKVMLKLSKAQVENVLKHFGKNDLRDLTKNEAKETISALVKR